MNARPVSPEALSDEDIQQELEELVARIQSRGPGVVLSEPSDEARRQFVARTANEPVMSAAELAEWQAEWDAVETEMRARDHADDVAEGRAR